MITRILPILAVMLAMVTFGVTPAGAKDGNAKEFVKEAAQGGMFEVEAGKLALSNASNADVKNFGNMMVTDHGKANQELTSIAQAKKMDMPKDLGKEYKEELAKLEKKQGKDFDGIYVDMMVKDHKKDVSQFKKMSSSLDDPELKGWVDKTLPVLEKHLHAAQQLEKTK